MSGLGPAFVYVLCLLTSGACAALLARSYLRDRTRFLAWVCAGFAALALNNLLLVADLVLLPSVDLWIFRQIALGLCIAVLLIGLLWELEA
ncbi:MAG TPA: DUF5985 family protein [Caulobacteraceae bacterium]|jgi:hypothetical protein